MKKWTGLFLCIVLSTACNDNVAETVSEVQDTLQEAVVEEEVSKVYRSFPQVFQYLEAQDPTFSEDSFLLAGENKVEPVPAAKIDEKQFEPFQKYLIYNGDSTQALDLYSYNYIAINRNGKQRLEEAGPDAEAAVVDIKNRTRRRIFFGGPSYALWDAKWVTDKEVLLIGAEMGEGDKMIPTIWQINLGDTSIQVFAYEGGVKADMERYKKEKLDMGN